MSWVPPHLLQRTKILYLFAEFCVVGGIASCMPSFSCMMARIVRCFGDSVKHEDTGRSHSRQELDELGKFRHSLGAIGSR
jgi:hypothetical protein